MPEDPIRGLLFDMDGTLVDNMRYHDQAWVEIMARLGIEIDIARFYRETAGRTNAEIFRTYLGQHLTDTELAEHAHWKETRYRELYAPHIRLLPGLREFLEAARERGIPMALATSAGQDNIAFVLEGLGRTDFFDTVIGGAEVRHGKPHPEMFLTAAERLGVPPEACLVFEDAPAGLEAAHRAGMRAVALLTTLTEAEARQNPAVIAAVPDFTTLRPDALQIDES